MDGVNQQTIPATLEQAIPLVLSLVDKGVLSMMTEEPSASAIGWEAVQACRMLHDKNSGLLVDCIRKNRFKNKPRGIDMAAWVATMAAIEETFGAEKVEKHRYRDVGR